MDGILLIDKPAGWTSHDVVAKVRSLLRQSGVESAGQRTKVGHTGTLDPMATGLLILVIGSYTKRAQEFSKLDKTYEVAMKLGATSTTGDAEGVISPLNERSHENEGKDKKIPSVGDVGAAITGFLGESYQTPHKFSAVKIGGQRAYKLARQGKEVQIEPRKVKIYEITDVKYEYPEIKFTAKVSSGTYIRSLVEDIGEKLGTGAYMSALNRTAVGNFSLADSISVEEADSEAVKENLNDLP